jgi:hypothetical protein
MIEKLNLNFLGLLIVLTFLNSNFIKPQPDYNMSLTNGVKISDSIVEFDVTIKGVDTSFTLTSYQCSFSFNREVANGGELTFTYLEGSSQLSNLPTFGIGINTNDGEPKLTFASMAGADQVTDSCLVVGRFRVVNTVPFANVDPNNIEWSFGGFVSTILTGDGFQNITKPINHTSNLTLSIKTLDTDSPMDYQLLQNYPNPFNPSTNIRFSLKYESEVRLVVYNILGEMIQELINNKIAAGNHEYTFNSDGLPSGTYIYRLEANNEIIGSKKMMLLK